MYNLQNFIHLEYRVENSNLKTLYLTNLKAVKTELKKSVAKMAQELKMSARTVNSYVVGERTASLEFVTQLCKIYNVNANWFCTGEGNMFNPPQFEQVKDDLAQRMDKMEKALKNAGLLKD